MSRDGELDRLTVLARDLAHLYVQFTNHFANSDAISIESFSEVFDASKVEYLHYCGGTTLDRPFFPAITDDLLQLSATYLSFPAEVVPRAVRTFGLLLSLFLYSTQPARQRSSNEDAEEKEEVVEGTVADEPQQPRAAQPAPALQALRDVVHKRKGGKSATPVEVAEAPSSSLPLLSSSLPRLPMRPIPISVSCMRQLLSCLSTTTTAESGLPSQSPHDLSDSHAVSTSVPLSYTETRVLLALHRAGAWHIEPYIREGPHVAALLAAHAECGAPLLTRTMEPPSVFAAALTARSLTHTSAPPTAAGGADSIFRNAEFVRLRREYETARQQLLQ